MPRFHHGFARLRSAACNTLLGLGCWLAVGAAQAQSAAHEEVARLLRAEAALGTPYCRMRSLEEASTWADCLRRESWRWAYTFSWHYQTENICKPYDVKANCSGGCTIRLRKSSVRPAGIPPRLRSSRQSKASRRS